MINLKNFIEKIFPKNSAPLKSTDTGYVNQNNQKNLGKTQLDGNHYNQKFYKMLCLHCKTEYHANGSDIWLKKCPNCQGGQKSSTLAAEFITEFQDTPIGTKFTKKEIVSRIHFSFGRNEDSIIPSDYCYNRLNNGIKYETQLHLFEYLGSGHYRYLGIDYPYTGKIFHKPKGGFEVCVGELYNGHLIEKSTPNLTSETHENEALHILTSSSPLHKTKRDVSVSLRFRVLKRDNFKCCACGASPAKDPSVELHVDHMVPWSKGGETTMDNLQTLCSRCNLGKSDHL